jgi:hypothetical protein
MESSRASAGVAVAWHAGNWSAIGNTLTLLEVTDGKSARCRDVCRPPMLAKNAVGREAAFEYEVSRAHEWIPKNDSVRPERILAHTKIAMWRS